MFRTLLLSALFVALLVYQTPADDTLFEALNADGDRFIGTLLSANNDKVVLQTSGEQKEIPLDRLSHLRNQNTNPFLAKHAAAPNEQSAQNIRYNNNIKVIAKVNGPVIINGQILINGQIPQAALPFPPRPNNPSGQNKDKNEDAKKIEFPSTVAVLELIDGSRLVAADFAMKNTTVSCRFLNGSEFTLPLKQLRSVRLSVKGLNDVLTPPDDWQKHLSVTEKTDRLITGQPGSLDAYAGILQETAEQTVSFSVDGETLPVPRRKIYGIIPAVPSGTDVHSTPSDCAGLLKQWDGSVLVLRSLQTNESGAVEWTTLSGISGVSEPAAIELFDFGRKNATYLSELPFVRKEQAVFFGSPSSADSPLKQFLQLREKQISSEADGGVNVAKTPPMLLTVPAADTSRQQLPDRPLPDYQGFQLNGMVYEHGLTLPAQCVLEYTLPGTFQSLRFVAGIDDRLRPSGRVVLRIQADGELLGEMLLQGTEPAVRKELSISGRKVLTLSVEYPDGFCEPAVLTLGDVKLIK